MCDMVQNPFRQMLFNVLGIYKKNTNEFWFLVSFIENLEFDFEMTRKRHWSLLYVIDQVLVEQSVSTKISRKQVICQRWIESSVAFDYNHVFCIWWVLTNIQSPIKTTFYGHKIRLNNVWACHINLELFKLDTESTFIGAVQLTFLSDNEVQMNGFSFRIDFIRSFFFLH